MLTLEIYYSNQCGGYTVSQLCLPQIHYLFSQVSPKTDTLRILLLRATNKKAFPQLNHLSTMAIKKVKPLSQSQKFSFNDQQTISCYCSLTAQSHTHNETVTESHAENIELFIDDQAFSPSYDLAPPSPTPVSKLSLFLSLPVCRRSSLLTGEGGRGWERSQIIRRRESLVIYKSFNTLRSQALPDVSF